MDFELPEETRALKDLVRRLVNEYQMPLEAKLLRGEEVTPEDIARGTAAAKAAGLWGLNLPKKFGGLEMSTLDNVVLEEENSRCLVPLEFGGWAPDFLFDCSASQKKKYLDPLISGEKHFAFAQTEPGGGGDPGGAIKTLAVRKGDNWVINGTKIFISFAQRADFFVVVAITDMERRQHGGVTLFLVDRNAPGFSIARDLRMLGKIPTCELSFDNVEVPTENVLGEVGQGFVLAQKMLSNQRLNIGAQSVGIADRCVQMMIEHAKNRVVFGEPLARKQAAQSMILDSWVDVHQTRLVIYNAAWKNDRREDTRVEAGLVKYLGSEMVGRVVDRAIQLHGAMGVTLEMPFSHWYTQIRALRIYEGPTDVQKYQVVARALLR